MAAEQQPIDGKQAYREAYERWQRDLRRLHEVLLNGKPLDPLHRVALLRSESHSHDRYEAERRKFLGLEPWEDEQRKTSGEEMADA
jgi:hypothetical protein